MPACRARFGLSFLLIALGNLVLAGKADESFPAAASAVSGKIPATAGWFEIPGTRLKEVCPPSTPAYEFSSYCKNVIWAWNGGIADTKRNRLIVWGGGHNDYYGNELYALDLNALRLVRLNDPSLPNSFKSPRCVEALPDGRPNSRHTYGGLAHIQHADRMFVFGGSLACDEGGGGQDTWTLDLATLQWKRMDPVGGGSPEAVSLAAVADYDPNTKNVFLHDRHNFWSYNYDRNEYRKLQSDIEISVSTNAVIDPKRRLFLIFGPTEHHSPGLFAIRIAPGSGYHLQDWSPAAIAGGCAKLMGQGGSDYPGLAYDPVEDRIVGWVNSGNTNSVYLFNPDTISCTTRTFRGGPKLRPETRGVFGRWRYFPDPGVFAVVNDWEANAYTLRLSPAGGAPSAAADQQESACSPEGAKACR